MPTAIDIARTRLAYFEQPPVEEIPRPSEVKEANKSADLFGADGLNFRDVLDAVNPLNHFPIVSDLFADATAHTPSAASKLVGGTLLGGPIGFITSLANIIFEEATGSSPVKTVMAALTGGEPEAVVAPNQSAMPESLGTISDPVVVASLDAPAATPVRNPNHDVVLDLYGHSPVSAHASYREAQLRPYLNDVTVSKLL